MYSYDRRASTVRPEVAIRIEGDEAIVSVLVGTFFGAYKKTVEGDTDAVRGQLVSLKGHLESISGSNADAVDDKASDILHKQGFEFSMNFKDRDPGLFRKQVERKKDNIKSQTKAFGKWLREGIVKFVEDLYKDFKSGRIHREPCVTASYVRDFLHNIPGWDNHRDFFQSLGNRKQLQACHYALESARKKGKLNSSRGVGPTGRDTRCYEPARW